MKNYFYSASLLFLISFTGCSSTNEIVQAPVSMQKNDNEFIEIYGKNIILDEELKSKYIKRFDAKYKFYPENNSIRVKNSSEGYFVNYDSKNRPEYYIELNNPMIIKNIKYIPNYPMNHPVDTVVGTPFLVLKKILDSGAPIVPSVSKLGVFKYNGKSYNGEIYDFAIEQNSNITVNNPFSSNVVEKIVIAVDESWMPLSYHVTKTMKWNPGKIQIEAIDMSDLYGILDYSLKNGNNKEENEDIILAVLQKDEALFEKLKNNSSKYTLPSVSFFNLPKDVDLLYAKNNKNKIFQEGIYKNTKGKYVKLHSDETVFDSKGEVRVQVKSLDVDNNKIQYNKKDEKNKSEYVDFSKGI